MELAFHVIVWLMVASWISVVGGVHQEMKDARTKSCIHSKECNLRSIEMAKKEMEKKESKEKMKDYAKKKGKK